MTTISPPKFVTSPKVPVPVPSTKIPSSTAATMGSTIKTDIEPDKKQTIIQLPPVPIVHNVKYQDISNDSDLKKKVVKKFYKKLHKKWLKRGKFVKYINKKKVDHNKVKDIFSKKNVKKFIKYFLEKYHLKWYDVSKKKKKLKRFLYKKMKSYIQYH